MFRLHRFRNILRLRPRLSIIVTKGHESQHIHLRIVVTILGHLDPPGIPCMSPVWKSSKHHHHPAIGELHRERIIDRIHAILKDDNLLPPTLPSIGTPPHHEVILSMIMKPKPSLTKGQHRSLFRREQRRNPIPIHSCVLPMPQFGHSLRNFPHLKNHRSILRIHSLNFSRKKSSNQKTTIQ